MGELKALRRWLRVAAVWAVAATAVAAFSLVVARDARERDDDASKGVERELGRVGRALDARFSDLERQVRALPRSRDVQRLEQRAERAEARAAGAEEDARRTGRRLDELDRRLDAVARRPSGRRRAR